VKVFLVFLLLAAAGAAYYYLFYRPAHTVLEVRYVLPANLALMDSPAEVRARIGELHAGERVEVYSSARNWARVRTAGGQMGWVESKDLLDAETFAEGRRLFKQVEQAPVQARGNLATDSTLRLNPSRQGEVIGNVAAGESVEIFGRKVVARSAALSEKGAEAAGDAETQREPGRDVWYLARRKGQAGWLIGRYVSLSIPQEIGAYAQDVNLVAWLVLDRVQDNGSRIPQYVVADRNADRDIDFSRIRVLTWWAQKHHYVVAYVESELNGYFPMVSGTLNGAPIFRLRLLDKGGRKFQKVYELFGSVVHVLGTVDGWESDAIPTGPGKTSKGRRESRHSSRNERAEFGPAALAQMGLFRASPLSDGQG
jgi:SH3 domain-containing protein